MHASQAKVMNSEQRKNIALKIITNNSTVTQISKQYNISRKFINQQTSKATCVILSQKMALYFKNRIKSRKSDLQELEKKLQQLYPHSITTMCTLS